MNNADFLIRHWQQVLADITSVRQQTAASQPVQLIAVSKTFPVNDIATLYQSGQRDFGENYIQEFSEKTSLLADLDIVWHMIGHIQSNKSRIVAERAQWVHTIDREKIARRLHKQRPEHLTPLNVCIEVNIAAEANKHGISTDSAELLALATTISTLPRLKLRGLMCVAKANSTEIELRQQFNQMHTLLQQLREGGFSVDVLSMGMSTDLNTAIACGATHVRVGSAIFGQRSYAETGNN
ncbi:YggS family pyridoxal phosphate enzyme [Snodgrassella communis]|jgi:PLP dependent protein|uniref:YggS family pyridoxal phosphate-dependent enzyme n=1 Tax=Snodgrassella communis TaxID=2946699 RepID=UPI000C1E9F1C|nr:YggS family pyridoxal phosphate-dependent enzyme [Snodgrassella communis]PIT21254.1 YggS family pyridoxal phosphate enzyme [Snodgrassella communis]PIT22730.1 YggS family pyridoxal phosphate enzyme [Snodgrassella communis]